MAVVAASEQCNGAGDQNGTVKDDVRSGDLSQPFGVERVDKTVEDTQGSLYADVMTGSGLVSAIRSDGDSCEKNLGSTVFR